VELGAPTGAQRWRALLDLIRFDRPIGWLLLLWPTLIALFLAADGMPRLDLLLIFSAGVFLTRSAGCIINDYADRWLDPHVQRTRARPLATGVLSARFALFAFAALMLSAFVLVCLTNTRTVLWSLGALAVTVIYPYCKRIIGAPQLVLGIAFSMGIPMAWTAQEQTPGWLAATLFLSNLLWTVAYDTQYAMVDRDDDRRMGARSTALLFGRYDRHLIALLQAAALLGMWWVGQLAGLGWTYDLALAVLVIAFGWQLWWIRGRDRAACLQAFRSNHWVGLVWFVGVCSGLSI
jgi:4-hydroxybenzoate polyprenyltransferase